MSSNVMAFFLSIITIFKSSQSRVIYWLRAQRRRNNQCEKFGSRTADNGKGGERSFRSRVSVVASRLLRKLFGVFIHRSSVLGSQQAIIRFVGERQLSPDRKVDMNERSLIRARKLASQVRSARSPGLQLWYR